MCWGLVLASAILLAGCDECERGTSRCDGSRKLERCGSSCSEPGCHYEWQPERCPGTCVEQSRHDAFCAESSTPNPRCTDRPGFCDGNVLVVCTGQHIVRRFACPTPERCMESAASPDAGPDVACELP